MGIRSLSTASISTGAKRSKIWDQSAVILNPAYESIATQIVGAGGAASITFSSIPSTYKHLQLRVTGRFTNSVSGGHQSQMRINGDTGTNYSYHTLYNNTNSTVGYDGAGNNAWLYGIDRFPAGNDTANAFGISILDILDYSNTLKSKTVKASGGWNGNGSATGQYWVRTGLWNSTSAINQIYFEPQGGGNYAQYTTFALYGIKG